jgi:hypothetical protein
MSYLDGVFSDGGADPDVIAAIQTQLTAQQALITAQQAAIAAIQTTDTAQSAIDTAQQAAIAATAALDVTQSAAIAASTASDAAQAAALAANAAVDSTQQSAIDTNTTAVVAHTATLVAHSTTLATQTSQIADLLFGAAANVIELNVARYSAGTLTQANFQAAIEACIAAAYTIGASMSDIHSEWNGSVRVRIPPGIWILSRGIVLVGPGLGAQATPALLGSGMHSTVLVTSSAMLGVYTAAIRAGGTADADTTYANRWECGEFSLVGVGGAQRNMNGIHVTLGFKPNLHDMQISGFQDQGQSPLYGYGIVIDDPYVDTAANVLGGARNNQHVQLRNVWSERNFAGFKFRSCSPCVMVNCHGNQNYFCDVVLDSSVMFYWVGGTMQGGGDSSASVQWFGTHKAHARVMTGWNKIQASGTGASCTTATGDVCTVTLTGAALVEGQDEFKWLELRHPTAPYTQGYGVDRGSGVYLITRILNATQCEVRKGSSHTAFSGYTWQLRTAEASFVELGGRLYHEGDAYAAVGMYGLESGATEPSVKVTGIVAQDFNGAALVESYAENATIIVEDNRPTNGTPIKVRARHAGTIRALDATLDELDLDEYSREGVICRTTGHVNASRDASRFGGIYTATSLGAGRLRTLCRDAGANAILDARVASSVALTGGTNVTGWTDLVGGAVAALEHAGQYPVYNASDANFAGKASILFGAGAAGGLSSKGMTLSLPAAKWTPRAHRPCLLVVARAAHTSQLDSSTLCYVALEDDANSYFQTYFNHHNLAGIGGAVSSQLGAAHAGTPVVPPSDPNYTGPHALIVGSAGRPGLQIDSELGYQHFSYTPERGWLGGHDIVLRMGTSAGTSATVDLWVAFAASFPHGISVKQRDRLLDAAANEYGVAGR